MSTARRTGIRPWGPARKFVAGLWRSWTLPPVVSRRLVVSLAVWPVLLFAFFIPEVGYLNAPPLFASASQPSGKADHLAQLQVRQLAVLAQPMEGQSSEDFDPAQIGRTNQLRQRVGTNILVTAGYLGEAYSVLDQEAYPPSSYYALTPDGKAVGCAVPGVPLPEGLAPEHVAELAVAIVAVEKFNRNVIQRFAERTYARLYRSAFGQLPDLSFGPAQIRLSLLRRIAAERPDWPRVAAWRRMSDDQLLDKLWQECDALKIVATIVVYQSDRLRQPSNGGFVADADVAAAYAGQRRRTAAPIDYASIVETMVQMMETKPPEKRPLPPPELPAPPAAPTPVGSGDPAPAGPGETPRGAGEK
jgi:hypothetical protein